MTPAVPCPKCGGGSTLNPRCYVCGGSGEASWTSGGRAADPAPRLRLVDELRGHRLVPPPARHSDPETSHAAAASITKQKQTDAQKRVLILLDAGPAHDYALLDRYNAHRGPRGWPPITRSGLQTRRCELVRMRLVEDSGERVTLDTGRRAIVWRRKGDA